MLRVDCYVIDIFPNFDKLLMTSPPEKCITREVRVLRFPTITERKCVYPGNLWKPPGAPPTWHHNPNIVD